MFFRRCARRIREQAARHFEMEPKPGNAFIPAGKAPGQRTGRTSLVHRRQRIRAECKRQQQQLAAASRTADDAAHNLAERNRPRKSGRVEQLASHNAPPLDLRSEGAGDGFDFGQFRHGISWDLRGLKQAASTRSPMEKPCQGNSEAHGPASGKPYSAFWKASIKMASSSGRATISSSAYPPWQRNAPSRNST